MQLPTAESELPFSSFYEVSRYYGNCLFISKSGATSVKALLKLGVLHRCH